MQPTVINLKPLRLASYAIPNDPNIQVAIYLIACDLKLQKLIDLVDLPYKIRYAEPVLCELVFIFAGIEGRTEELYHFYYDLLEQHCGKVTPENELPVKTAYYIYDKLKMEEKELLRVCEDDDFDWSAFYRMVLDSLDSSDFPPTAPPKESQAGAI